GKVCSFEILTKGVPFEVDEKGVVKNTEPLDPAKQEVWQFSVVAKSCDPHDLPSDEVKVIVKVKPACQAEWIGIRERMDFSPHDGKILIAPEAELDTCDDKCNVTKATVSIKLNTEHIGKGCDRDTYSLHSQRKLCGANPEAVDLLPSPLAPDSWTRNLPTDDGKESDEVFAFDGKHDSVIVPLQIKLGREFSISTWMKHDDDDEDEGDSESIHRKENILCISDNEEMNRQHMSLFVRRCHLVLLLRQEPDSGLEQDGFAPAEWRWSLPEICDGSWHHYTVVAPLPRAKLFVDGKAFIENKKNFNVVNDFPMHLTKKVHSTKVAIGGCWMGGMQHVSNHFKGYLAGLSLLNNRVESNSAIQCLTRCQEKLDFNAVEDMDSGMAVSMNSDMTSITINGPSLKNVETLLRKISYVNTRNFPTPGHRPVTFDTELTCSNGRHLEVAPLKSLLIVSRVEKPVITLNAVLNIQEEAEEISKGVGFLKDFQIFAHSKNQADEYNLDSCSIHMPDPLSSQLEQIKPPLDLVKQLGLNVKVTGNGVVISGVDKLENYERVLSGTLYAHANPLNLNQRKFKVSCSELNGRYSSNVLEVVQPEPQSSLSDKLVQPAGNVQPSVDKQGQGARLKAVTTGQSAAAGVVIVCIICIGFIVLLATVGISRIRNAQRHSNVSGLEDKQEMEWDNSALTITVNPMDQEHHRRRRLHHLRHNDDDETDVEEEDEEEEVVSDDHEDDEDGDGVMESKMKKSELEWDDSTLSY
ncbi:hypothetical protein HELRODRAFT_75655, partial [Helobdella robusta]|uniref:Calsyntenin C-terminal domain-containing protein n=1 Tax=Helobdella robusta TaxID=6412 RepID=T1G284_HELRO